MQWSWREIGDSLDSPLWPVVWSAAVLLVSEEAGRIRMCGGQDCGWMYVDRSRNGLRRWCRMETCGTQAKSRRRRERISSRPWPSDCECVQSEGRTDAEAFLASGDD